MGVVVLMLFEFPVMFIRGFVLNVGFEVVVFEEIASWVLAYVWVLWADVCWLFRLSCLSWCGLPFALVYLFAWCCDWV